jgi:NurA domain
MLVPGKVEQALTAKGDEFQRSATEASLHRASYGGAWNQFAHLSSAEIVARLADTEWPGARLAEDRGATGPIVRFGERWETARDARLWALERLQGIPTVAVDGSQIAASKEFAVPVSLVQVSWFENYHDPERPYLKDVCNEIVTVDGAGGEVEEYVFAESTLNRTRFVLEMQTAVNRIHALPPDPPPVVFIDGSFVLSFAGRMPPKTRDAYLNALFDLLDASAECAVPVVGFVDRSFASDLVTLLRTLFDLPAASIVDADILTEQLQPFDRTIAFECARGDVIPLYEATRTGYVHDLLFVYLQTGQGRLPVRIDFPRWILEAGLLDHVIDVVRAEAVVGSGYPYALETADATAVLSTEDRMAFYRLFHQFADASGFSASLPAKSMSKARRR